MIQPEARLLHSDLWRNANRRRATSHPTGRFSPLQRRAYARTVAQLEEELLNDDGLLLRYRTDSGVDGLEPGEHPFLACSFWLVEQYARSGRQIEAKILMDKLVGLANELGLLSEEYAANESRMAGNFPQAFSRLTLVRAADAMHGIDRLSLSGDAAV